MVLSPQHHPYTDLLEVLICGGSTPSGHYALDNCVSTQPEVANLVWTIERMVSVMLLDEADVLLTLFLAFQACYAAHGRAAWRYLYRHEQV
jgi:hypothetical protein